MKKFFNKILLCLMVFFLSFGMVACGNTKIDTSSDNQNQEEAIQTEKEALAKKVAEKVDLKSGYSFSGSISNVTTSVELNSENEKVEKNSTNTLYCQGYIYDKEQTANNLVMFVKCEAKMISSKTTYQYIKLYVTNGVVKTAVSELFGVQQSEIVYNTYFEKPLSSIIAKMFKVEDVTQINQILAKKITDLVGYTSTDVLTFSSKIISKFVDVKLENSKITISKSSNIGSLANSLLSKFIADYSTNETLYVAINDIAQVVASDSGVSLTTNFVDSVLNELNKILYTSNGKSTTVNNVIAYVDNFFKTQKLDLTVKELVNTIGTKVYSLFSGSEFSSEKYATIYDYLVGDFGSETIKDVYDALTGQVSEKPTYENIVLSLTYILKNTKLKDILPEEKIAGFATKQSDGSFVVNYSVSKANYLFKLIADENGNLKSLNLKQEVTLNQKGELLFARSNDYNFEISKLTEIPASDDFVVPQE